MSGAARNILITDQLDESALEILHGEGFAVDYRPGMPAAEIAAAIAGADALIVRSQTQVTAGLLEGARKLAVVGRAGAGVDNIDVAAATRRGILVMNTPGGNTVSTAEHTFSLLLALARNIPQANESLRAGKWDRKRFTGVELFEKTLGIVGLGKVGRELAVRAQAFGMRVVAYDPLVASEAAAKLGIEQVDLDDLYAASDFISVHTPLTAETQGLIGAAAFARCRPGVRIVNCARGGIVNETDLLAALEEGRVAGAALDVFETEPPGDSPLIRHPRVVATPHLGASTGEAQEKVAVQIARQVVDFLKQRGLAGSVNGGSIRLMFRKEFRPYVDLAGRMGNFLAQLRTGDLRRISLEAAGSHLADIAGDLTSVLLKGVFEKLFSEPVNELNAALFARERGIAVQTTAAAEHEHPAGMLTVQYSTTREERTFAGTVFGSGDVRITEIDGFHFEIHPEGNLLCYSNIDRPGMLASVSSILAAAEINIGGLSLGRYRGGMKALTVISLDSRPARGVIERIGALDGVSEVRLLIL